MLTHLAYPDAAVPRPPGTSAFLDFTIWTCRSPKQPQIRLGRIITCTVPRDQQIPSHHRQFQGGDSWHHFTPHAHSVGVRRSGSRRDHGILELLPADLASEDIFNSGSQGQAELVFEIREEFDGYCQWRRGIFWIQVG